MIAIIAVNNLGFIGKENELMWRCSEDLKHFKTLSLYKEMLCGFNTYQTLPEVVKKRGIWQDQRDKYCPDDIKVLCIGGKKTYEKYCHLFTELHISHINDNQIGDCIFPNLSNLNPDCKIFNYYFEVNQ